MSEENKNSFNEENVEQNEVTETETDTVYFSDSTEQQQENNTEKDRADKSITKEKKRISIKALVISLIAAVVASVMLTYSICSAFYQSLYAQAYVDANQNSYLNGNTSSTGVSELDIIADIINAVYYGETDSKKLMEAAIEEYIRQTGDIYASYYTQEELEAMMQEDLGKSVGIGVNVIDTTVNYNGTEISAMKIFNVIKDSPAQKNGVKIGDYVYAVVIDGQVLTIDALGYDEALNKLRGDEGTTVSFLALRKEGDSLKEYSFNIVREAYISNSVYWRIPNLAENVGKKIGVVKITTFDYTTPTQFSVAIEELKAQGCEKFIFDVRYNLGGYESSIGAILSYFLNEGDVYLRTKDKKGNIKSSTVGVVSKFEGDYSGCNVSKEDIGKYKDLDCVVLCNEYTASAAELFVATFKDYELATIIGNTTFGKGKLQHTYYLDTIALLEYGVSNIGGAVKITTHEYFSAKSDSYDGIGIEPNEKVALRDEAWEINIYNYESLDPIDDQLLKAINILNG